MKTALRIPVHTGGGAAAGAVAYAIIGGVGLAFKGTAVGLGLMAFMAIGAGLGLVESSAYSLGKSSTEKRKMAVIHINLYTTSTSAATPTMAKKKGSVPRLLWIVITNKGY